MIDYSLEKIDQVVTSFTRLAELLPAKKKQANYKKGQDFYSLSVDDDGKCEINTYRISNIDKRGIYLIWVTSWTWGNRAAIGKRFSNTKDHGWLQNIPSWCKHHYRHTDDIKQHGHMHTTKLAALKDFQHALKYFDKDDPALLKAQKTIKSMLVKMTKK